MDERRKESKIYIFKITDIDDTVHEVEYFEDELINENHLSLANDIIKRRNPKLLHLRIISDMEIL